MAELLRIRVSTSRSTVSTAEHREPIRGNVARTRCDRGRSPGHRRALLHIYLDVYLTCTHVRARELRVVVLDRPNPINGVTTEGPVLDPNYKSFVGHAPDSGPAGTNDWPTGSTIPRRSVPENRSCQSCRCEAGSPRCGSISTGCLG